MGSVKHDKIKRLERKLGVRATPDPEGVMGLLQITRRYVTETNEAFIYSFLNEALEAAVPNNPAVAWWTAHHAIVGALPEGYTTIGHFVADEQNVKLEDVVALLDRAIKNQGTINIAVSKRKGRK
jgi:hypothetical protein